MKKNNNLSGSSLIGFLLFLLTIGATSTCSIFVYYWVRNSSNDNIWLVGLAVLLNIVVGAIICTIFDIIRRRKEVEKPVKMILEATKKIASGDFDVQLVPFNEYGKYFEYDLIFENINTMTKELSKNEILKNDFISMYRMKSKLHYRLFKTIQ